MGENIYEKSDKVDWYYKQEQEGLFNVFLIWTIDRILGGSFDSAIG